MGADGGTIARRTDMVRVKADSSASDPAQRLRLLWTLCRLSREPLVQPVVADQLGRMYNREAMLLHLAARAQQQQKGELDEVAHVRRMADVTTLKLTPSPEASSSDAPESLSRSSTLTTARSSFLCPLTQRAMNGRARFVYMGRCGCVMSEQGLRATCTPSSSSSKRKAPGQEEAAGSGSGSDQEGSEKGKDMQPCPLCATPFDAAVLAKGEVSPTGEVVVLNPTAEEEAPMRAAMEARRAIEAKEKAERKSKSKKLDAGVEGGEDEAEKQRRKEEKKARKAEAAAMLAAALEEGPGSKRQKLEGPSVETMNAGAGAGSAAAAIMAKAKKEGDKKEMSPALRSMYGLDLDKRKKVGSDWMVRGTFGRFA